MEIDKFKYFIALNYTMWFSFTKTELFALEALCVGEQTPKGLAVALRKNASFVSRVLGKLEEKGLILRNGRLVKLSPAGHAQAFKRLYDSRPNAKIEEALWGSAMDVLLILAGSEEGVGLDAIVEEADCSRATVFKALKTLYSAGLVAKNGRNITITDQFAAFFAAAYANSLADVLLTGSKGYNVSIRVRKHVVVRTDAKAVPDFFNKTGINKLMEKGLEAVKTSYDDYYFDLGRVKRDISTEEAFIHALLLTTLQQHQDRPVLTSFLIKNGQKLRSSMLRGLAKKYLVEGVAVDLEKEVELMRNVASYHQKGLAP
ncbi:helix-turn-helix domain-containing protein [Candidatus Micrarchaeota archaeon]|nr:helix-turn-helix domain-containing protein [Candidatus Micrarchaeota archaeon]